MRGQAFRGAVLAAIFADSVNDLEPVAPFSDHLPEDLGRVLKVDVHWNDRFAVSMVEARRKRGFLAKVPGEGDHPDPRVPGVRGTEQLDRIVDAPVIDEEDLEASRCRVIETGDDWDGALEEGWNGLLLVLHRHDNRKDRGFEASAGRGFTDVGFVSHRDGYSSLAPAATS